MMAADNGGVLLFLMVWLGVVVDGLCSGGEERCEYGK